ncbi:unnamed protein product [Phaedon cochleariae]|uniref:CLIP domain-containing serine protease n=1 Tax=Phaedon cochleariae TaxID=80249 RepID=A0A9N9S882_PHACE|nr:unnamed protein product [Phaedon cochleariae]
MALFVVVLVLLCECFRLSEEKLYITFRTQTCGPPRGEICVEIRKCPFFDDLLDRSPIPRPRSVINIIRAHHCDFQGNVPFVCCNRTAPIYAPPPTLAPLPYTHPAYSSPEQEFTQRTQTKRTTRATKRRSRTTAQPFYDSYSDVSETLLSHANFRMLPQDTCGPISTNARITNGRLTDLNEFPWMALIAYKSVSDDSDEDVVFKCAGTLITDRFVLTAAHCILDTTIRGVRLGEYDLDSAKDCNPDSGYCAPPPQDFAIENIHVHPEYDDTGLRHDIALIKLTMSANINFANVQPICLPTSDTNLNGKNVIVSGWGVTENGLKSPVLRKASIPVVSLPDCRKTYQRFPPITSSQICAGGTGAVDSCAGDSGGPLKFIGQVDDTPRFIQYGIVSYGPKYCGTHGKPGIYTNVFKYMEWILDHPVH